MRGWLFRRTGRLRQRLRCSSAVGHFWKWDLGDGVKCPWCRLCRALPVFQRLIPYSRHGLFCWDCGYVWPDGEDLSLQALTCPHCGHVSP